MATAIGICKATTVLVILATTYRVDCGPRQVVIGPQAQTARLP